MKSYNELTVTLKLKRIDVCNLLLASTILKHNGNGGQHWGELHDKLNAILSDFDKKHLDEYLKRTD